AVRVLAESRDPRARGVDLPGVVTFTVSAGAFTYALMRAGSAGWTSRAPLAWFALGLGSLVAFAIAQRRRRYPMLDLNLLRRAAFVGVLVTALVVSMAAFAYGVFSSVWLQTTLGLGPVGAGLAMLPMAGAAFVVSAVTARRLVNMPRLAITLGLVLVGVGALMQTRLGAGSSWTALVPGLVVCGIGVGTSLPSLNSAAMAVVPVERSGMAAAAVNTARQLGMALGIAALGTVFAHRLARHP